MLDFDAHAYLGRASSGTTLLKVTASAQLFRFIYSFALGVLKRTGKCVLDSVATEQAAPTPFTWHWGGGGGERRACVDKGDAKALAL